MSNLYDELKAKHQAEVDAFPIHYAFGYKQINDKVKELGFANESELRKNVIALGYTGGFILKTDLPAFEEMNKRHLQEIEDAINNKETGEQFAVDMFEYELNNHEFGYTGDEADTLEALGYSESDIEANPFLKNGLETAISNIISREKSQEAIERRWQNEQEYDRLHDEPDICDE